ncbi:DUF957 domain-containing protein [Serratia fonticola]|uniref:DUF957 domain-containing protein n=1 Tax=Serratia fonticola TaxID=47917 RepID=UPI00093A41E1|nr:DUF957 domain-containing protein [Serratia fonticola]OKP18812.1 hypothetical protein BSQ40_27740 [Serratia fonticola]
MIKASVVMEGLTILARWLEGNINCESEICFDDPEVGTDSEKILPCVEAALALMSATLPNDGQEPSIEIRIRAQGESNSYVLLKDNTWFALVLMNGEMTTNRQEGCLRAMVAGLNNGHGAE